MDLKISIQLFNVNLNRAEKALKNAMCSYSLNKGKDWVFNGNHDQERKLEDNIGNLFDGLLREFEKIHELILKQYPVHKKVSEKIMDYLIRFVNGTTIPARNRDAFTLFDRKEGYMHSLQKELISLEAQINQ